MAILSKSTISVAVALPVASMAFDMIPGTDKLNGIVRLAALGLLTGVVASFVRPVLGK